ncbi:hypothetical protein GQ55_2G165400 [Panicum hallii var. hallii]|uniref:Uncharacterized protein n=1 Tax=Panicum hallii var. hallii TaxID=1504633 RepID=A0A2T7EQ06_9POAL|nr:hypothetical protein GQ55_2G165400 [Panicum hallii var. hallii]
MESEQLIGNALQCQLILEGIIGLQTGGYGMAYKLQRLVDFVISKLNLLTTLYSDVLYLYRFGLRYYLDWASGT